MAHEAIPQAGASKPNMARVYDYLLNGKDNFAADRDLAERMQAEAGDGDGVRELARINRKFILKAVQWSASMLGICQFIDIGCGLPSRPAVHDAARDGCEGARVVYADRDPVVVSHAAALMGGPGLAAILADASDPVRVLLDADMTGLIDLTQPACLVLGGTLSTMAAAAARSAVEGYAEALAPGSAVIISCASYADPETGRRMEALFGAALTWRNHGCEDVASFFAAGGLRLVRGKVSDVRCWPLAAGHDEGAAMLGGIGIKD